jgi:ABC-type multidrug transport system ATPase subunit
VALATFALVPANVLLLDEASNHLDAQTITTLTGVLQGFNGAIVAITHNASFAASLNATHLLRVSDGTAKLSDNFGLTAADFEHTPKKASGSTGGKKGRSRAGSTASSAASSMEESMDEDSSNSRRAKSNGAASSSKPAAAASSARSGANGSKADSSSKNGSGGSSTATKAGKKRTTLAYKEQLEYQALCKELEKLNGKRADLEAEVARLAQQGSSGLAQLQVASTKLGDVAGVIEDKELRWLELAELAGDL